MAKIQTQSITRKINIYLGVFVMVVMIVSVLAMQYLQVLDRDRAVTKYAHKLLESSKLSADELITRKLLAHQEAIDLFKTRTIQDEELDDIVLFNTKDEFLKQGLACNVSSDKFCYDSKNGFLYTVYNLTYGDDDYGVLVKKKRVEAEKIWKNYLLLLIMGPMVVFLIFSVFLGIYINRNLINPFNKIIKSIQPLATGHFDISLPVASNMETRMLIEVFKKLIGDVKIFQELSEKSAHLAAIGSSTAMVAHDVRRPLASVKALLNVLPSLQNDPERVKKMAAEVDRVITSTNSLLNDIMDFSRDSTVLNLDDHGPDSVIIAAIGDALRSHPEAEVKLEYEFGHETKPMHADSQRMIRVLTNIIGNALEVMVDKKTGKASGVLFIRTYLAKRDGKEFVGVSVSDDGPGIPEEALPKLFDPFFTQGKKGGTGLGLAICQKVIDMHGGRISARNREGVRGAEFVIEVPAGEGRCGVNYADIIDHSSELRLFREEEAKRVDIGDTASTAEFMRINKERGRISTLLIVDDEPLFRETIRSTLNTLGQVKDYVKVIEVDSAETGLKVFEAREFDYVIADIDLGRSKMNGYTFAQKILQEHPSAYVLIHSNKRKVELDEKVRVIASAEGAKQSPAHNDVREIATPAVGGLAMTKGHFMGFLPKPMKPSELLQFLACKSFEEYVIASGAKQSPAYSDVQEIATATSRPRNNKADPKIALLLNDDEGLLMCFGDDLKKLGYQVLDAKNVSGAMEYFINRKIDMIVSDINLGDCEPTGYDFLTKVREKDPKVPFVFTSGYNRRDEWNKAQTAGATEYLQIPYELHELKKALGM